MTDEKRAKKAAGKKKKRATKHKAPGAEKVFKNHTPNFHQMKFDAATDLKPCAGAWTGPSRPRAKKVPTLEEFLAEDYSRWVFKWDGKSVISVHVLGHC